MILTLNSGVRIRLHRSQDATDPLKVTALRALRLPDIQGRHPLTSLNMVVCLLNKGLHQPDQCPANLQLSMAVNKAAMGAHLNSLQPHMEVSQWDMAVLQVLADMAVHSRHLLLNGVSLRLKDLRKVDSVATKGNPWTIPAQSKIRRCELAFLQFFALISLD